MASLSDPELARLIEQNTRGYARVPLQALNFNHTLATDEHRTIDPKNIKRIIQIFSLSGCKRLQKEHFIDAIIGDEDLETALTASGVFIADLSGPSSADLPLLNPLKLDCLSGLHRIEAAKSFLDDNDQWWVVRLLSADLPKPVQVQIVQRNANEKPPPDGEVFRRILHARREGDKESEDRWWSYIDKTKPRDLKQLLKVKGLEEAFGKLIDLPGLWAKIQLGALHRMLALKCTEEIIHILEDAIAETWMKRILSTPDRILSPSIVDDVTAEKLAQLAPKYSASDRELVEYLMKNYDIFPSIRDESIRKTLLHNICTLPCLIPTLWTFFETLKYIEPICECLRELIGSKWKGTIRSSLKGCFFRPEKTLVQKSESHDVEIVKQLTNEEAFEIAYMQLWAFGGRLFDGLTRFTPRMENRRAKPLIKGPNPVLWQHFAKFALSRGFRTTSISELAAGESLSQLAKEYLSKANPLSTTFSVEEVQRAVLAGSHAGEVSITPSPESERLHIERRHGRPFEGDLAMDKSVLFLPQIYLTQNQNFPEATLELIRYDLFASIFGSHHWKESDIGTTHRLNLPAISSHSGANDASERRKKRRFEESESRSPPDEEKLQLTARIRELERENEGKLQLKAKIRELERQRAVLLSEKRDLVNKCRALEVVQTKTRSAPQEEPAPTPSVPVVATEPDCDTHMEGAPDSTVLAPGHLLLQAGETEEALIARMHEHDCVYMSRQEGKQPNQYEIFVVSSRNDDGSLRGVHLDLDPDKARAVAQIKQLLEALDSYIQPHNIELGAMTQFGKWLSELNGAPRDWIPEQVFQACESQLVCFIGARNLLHDYQSSEAAMALVPRINHG